MKRNIIEGLYNDYLGNDLNYDSIKMEAESCIAKMAANGEEISWREVAKNMGLRLETLNYDDLELTRSAIEDAMLEDEEGYEDYEINENSNKLKQKQTIKLNESQLRNLIKKSINEAVCEDEYDLPWPDRKPKNDMERLRLSRYNGLVEIIEYYSAQDCDGKPLSKEQYEQLKNTCDTLECFGEPGQGWAEFGREILSRNEHASMNESKLRKIIKEALNELDWKTYANAAKKQADVDGEYKLSHDKPNRAYKFNLAASNEFNKKHGHKGNYTDDFRRLGATEPTNWETTELPKLHLVANDLCDIENGFLCRDFNDSDKSYYVNKGNSGRVKQTKKIPSKTLGKHPELMQKFKDAEKEMGHYYNGDYDYTPEKGWHLKESMLNKIIKESIKKVLGY